jgi:hypothetical protein
MGQHRSAQVISLRVAKESMAGFAPATIGDVLKSNKISETNVLKTTTPHGRLLSIKSDISWKAYIRLKSEKPTPAMEVVGGCPLP